MEGVVWRQAAFSWQVLEELLMIELIQLERRKPEEVRLVKVMPRLLDALSREKQARLGGAMFQQAAPTMKKTVRSIRDIVALERRKPEDAASSRIARAQPF
jgi:hypothetical protein